MLYIVDSLPAVNYRLKLTIDLDTVTFLRFRHTLVGLYIRYHSLDKAEDGNIILCNQDAGVYYTLMVVITW